ncbi:hypothetical protein BC938DRAFT_477655 [Jimgerdemannia flammicorona]|uniref:RING-type domain-containing protein n=1 Tax=Jimgerdemannia flammicorona TaxID=994334 RepID=A0A433P8K7_9FUNG|nr:hypothetical protein BC938DRAFT_477655 [Jimgerdemannia flammicorona]
MGSTLSKDTPNPSSGTPPPTSAWQSDQQIDYGSLLPNGIYPGSPQDYDHRVVRRLICDRRLSPFYKGLADEPVSVGDPSEEDTSAQTAGADHTHHPSPAHAPIIKKPESFGKSRERSSSNSSTYSPSGTENAKAKQKLEAERKKLFVEKKLYKDALECPICFLYYPANINHSRCCAQPICTECFVQIKRPPETPSTSASCPFCVEPNFGVYYKPPEWAEKTVEVRRGFI